MAKSRLWPTDCSHPLCAQLFKNGNALYRVYLRQAMPVPYTGSQSPFLQGSYKIGKDGYVVTYKTFVEEFKPRLAVDPCVGAFYADILNGFAGKCVSIKIKNNHQWPVVKSIQSQRLRAINPRYTYTFFSCALQIFCFLLVHFWQQPASRAQ